MPKGSSSGRRALTITETVSTLAVVAALVSIAASGLGRLRNASGVDVSLSNLQAISKAYASYAAEWDDRQPTLIVDNFSTYGSSGPAAMQGYFNATGSPHPPVVLGQCAGGIYAYYMAGASGGNGGNYITAVPLDFTSRFGAFRLQNARILHSYLDGMFYSETFYPPNDRVEYNVVSPWFDGSCEFDGTAFPSSATMWASYCASPAAMFDPLVLRAPSAGGYKNPYSLPTGFKSPAVSQARHPSLKTRMLEHHWNQNAPTNPCNPAFAPGTYAGCEPYYFNMGRDSAPATMFFDGSVRLLPNDEAFDADSAILQQTGGVDGSWHRGTPMGANGYFAQLSVDGLILSHHILTTDGILGRDTLGPSKPR